MKKRISILLFTMLALAFTASAQEWYGEKAADKKNYQPPPISGDTLEVKAIIFVRDSTGVDGDTYLKRIVFVDSIGRFIFHLGVIGNTEIKGFLKLYDGDGGYAYPMGAGVLTVDGDGIVGFVPSAPGAEGKALTVDDEGNPYFADPLAFADSARASNYATTATKSLLAMSLPDTMGGSQLRLYSISAVLLKAWQKIETDSLYIPNHKNSVLYTDASGDVQYVDIEAGDGMYLKSIGTSVTWATPPGGDSAGVAFKAYRDSSGQSIANQNWVNNQGFLKDNFSAASASITDLDAENVTLTEASTFGAIYANGSGTLTSTGYGAAGKVLTANGVGVAPTWGDSLRAAWKADAATKADSALKLNAAGTYDVNAVHATSIEIKGGAIIVDSTFSIPSTSDDGTLVWTPLEANKVLGSSDGETLTWVDSLRASSKASYADSAGKLTTTNNYTVNRLTVTDSISVGDDLKVNSAGVVKKVGGNTTVGTLGVPAVVWTIQKDSVADDNIAESDILLSEGLYMIVATVESDGTGDASAVDLYVQFYGMLDDEAVDQAVVINDVDMRVDDTRNGSAVFWHHGHEALNVGVYFSPGETGRWSARIAIIKIDTLPH